MRENSVEVGKAAGIWAYVYAVLDWVFSVPMDRWATGLAIIGGLCAITAYLFDIRKKRMEIRLLEMRLDEMNEADHE